MPNDPPVTVTPVPAATILLVRDGRKGLEVFLMERHAAIGFAAGALVFPGGKVDQEDSDPALLARCAGCDGLTEDEKALRVAAIRETLEESGVLLARRRGENEFVSPTELDASLDAGDKHGFLRFVDRADLVLACDALVPFAHWITPERNPKRYDTHFFIAHAPVGQKAVHDGWESVESIWLPPQAAIADGEAGRRYVMFPTKLNLEKLDRSATAAEAIEAARSWRIVEVMPVTRMVDGERILMIPEEADYGASEFVVSNE